jgi:acid phosphatase
MLGDTRAPGNTSNPHERLNAVVWHQSSGEYLAVTNQAYRTARKSLDVAFADPNWTAALEQQPGFATLPPAIVLDIDETVLDNTRYEARVVKDLGRYSTATFDAWSIESKAEAIPGVTEFLQYADSRGVTVFYTTGRKLNVKDATLANLRSLGLPIDQEGKRLLANDGSTTSQRHQQVAQNYRILLLIGDNLDDFIDGSQVSPEERRKIALSRREWFGERWIILPNAIYGHWEASLYNYDYNKPREEILKRIIQSLRT